jgi:hypothetical protein
MTLRFSSSISRFAVSREFLFAFVLVLVLTLSVAAPAAHAQGAVYVTPIFTRISTSKVDTDPTFAFLGAGVSSRMFYGVNIGAYYDVPQLSTPKIEVGLDVRDSILHGNNAFINNFLVGPRIAAAPFQRPLHLYVQPVVGAASSHAPNTQVKVTRVEYGVFAGVDYKFSRVVTWRALEVGYASAQTASGQTIGGSETIPNVTMINLSSGLIFNIPKINIH